MILKDTDTRESISFNDYFSRVSIINLRDRVDRKIEIEHQLEKISLSLSSPGVELYITDKSTVEWVSKQWRLRVFYKPFSSTKTSIGS